MLTGNATPHLAPRPVLRLEALPSGGRYACSAGLVARLRARVYASTASGIRRSRRRRSGGPRWRRPDRTPRGGHVEVSQGDR